MEEIKKRIVLMGVKKSHVAKRIGIHPSELSMYLSGKREIPVNVLTALKNYVGL